MATASRRSVSDQLVPPIYFFPGEERQWPAHIPVILPKDPLKLAFLELSLFVEGFGITSMLRPVDRLDVDGEQRAGDPRGAGEIAHVQDVKGQGRCDGYEEVEA